MVPQFAHILFRYTGFAGGRLLFLRRRVLIVVVLLMSCSCELVASSVLTMTMLPIAVLRVSVSLCSRSIDCTCWLLDPQIRVLMIISSAFVNLHSLIRTRILLRNASTISPFSALKFAACTLLSGNYSLEIHNSRIFPIKYPDFSPPLRLKETKLTQVRCLRHPNKSINS